MYVACFGGSHWRKASKRGGCYRLAQLVKVRNLALEENFVLGGFGGQYGRGLLRICICGQGLMSPNVLDICRRSQKFPVDPLDVSKHPQLQQFLSDPLRPLPMSQVDNQPVQ